MKLEDLAIGRLLRRLGSYAGDRAEVRRSILADLERGDVPHQVQTLGDAGANIIVSPGPETRLAFSVHYDGDDLNGNLCSVAVPLNRDPALTRWGTQHRRCAATVERRP